MLTMAVSDVCLVLGRRSAQVTAMILRDLSDGGQGTTLRQAHCREARATALAGVHSRISSCLRHGRSPNSDTGTHGCVVGRMAHSLPEHPIRAATAPQF